MLACTVSGESEGNTSFSRSQDNARIGVFDGVNFDEWDIEREPHLLSERNTLDVRRSANGQFLVAAVGEHGLDLLTDPWGTLPVYVFVDRDSVAFSVSLDALRRCFIKDHDVLNTEGVAQLFAFGTTLDGQTVYPGIRRLGRAMLYRARRSPSGWEVSEEEYFRPEVEPSEYRGIDADVVDSFRTAVRKLLRKSGGDLFCTLTGGLDSRTIAAVLSAEGADTPLVTHAVREGHDLRIAREVAAGMRRTHTTVWLPASLPLDGRANAFCGGSNGALAFNNYHVMWAFAEYAALARFEMDGVHTSIEGRWFMRNDATTARSRASFLERVFRRLLRPELLRLAEDPGQCAKDARDVLSRLVPDPKDFASPGCCADVFNVCSVLPNHGTDGALLQNHYVRFISPYYDRDYVSVVSRVAEHRRWMQHPQRTIIRTFAPSLLRIARAYSDVRTWPLDNPLLLRVPVALERAYRKVVLPHFPGLFQRRSRHSSTLGYTFHTAADPGEVRVNSCPPNSLAHLTFPSDIRSLA